MRVKLRFFAVVRERLQRDEGTLELPAGATCGDALDALGRAEDTIPPLRPYLRVAVNQQMVGLEHVLADGDEVALIPPVAGGAESARHAIVVDRPLSLDAVVAAVRAPGRGGIATFVGCVRAQSQGRAVVKLEYEAYAAMAEKVFVDLCEELERELPGVRVAVEHRVGTLAVGDDAVAIAAAAPHRADAFRACQAMIDRLKDRAPIWKRETGPDGTSWVGLGP